MQLHVMPTNGPVTPATNAALFAAIAQAGHTITYIAAPKAPLHLRVLRMVPGANRLAGWWANRM